MEARPVLSALPVDDASGVAAGATPFVGRETDLEEVAALLSTPTCRLITLVGPGGIGKTRLALELAARAAGANRPVEPVPAFRNGVRFAALQAVPSADRLAPAIIEALKAPTGGQDDPRTHLLRLLRERATLLVLDNFEHLVDGASLLSEILATAPAVRLLVTSREALNLRDEWRYPVQGLPYLERGTAGDLADYGAVQLFVQCARRARRDFSLDGERDAVARVCRLVGGMPLALELAAAWTSALPCGAIAAELEAGLALLATRLRDVPERHRSMRAVFDESWRRLTDEERAVFRRLSAFRGGFRYEAAAAVAGASPRTLSDLVDRSLLTVESSGRYRLHELLRQFAEELLREIPGEGAHGQAAHGAYYLNLLEARLSQMMGADQTSAIAEVRTELDNVRAAWSWAVERADADRLRQAAPALGVLHHRSGSYREGVAAFEAALSCLDDHPSDDPSDLARLTVMGQLGRLYVRLGRIIEGEEMLGRAEPLHARLGRPAVPGMVTDPRLGLGQIAMIRGDYAAAARLAEAAGPTAEAHGHVHNHRFAWDLRARVAMHLSHLEEARQYAWRARELAESTGDRWTLAYTLNVLGTIAIAQQDHARARTTFEASLAILQELGDQGGVAVALNKLGIIALQQGDLAEARRAFDRSRVVYEEIGDAGGLTDALEGLGNTAAAEGDHAAARAWLNAALGAVSGRAFGVYLPSLLVSVAELAVRTGQPVQIGGLLALAKRHPTSTHEARDRAAHLLGRAPGAPPDADDNTAIPSGQEMVELMRDVLAGLTFEGPSVPAPPSPVGAGSAPALIEPLSARELEVLRLVSGGLSNKEIAARLIVAPGTVKAHVHNICGKLEAANRTGAVGRARELGLL